MSIKMFSMCTFLFTFCLQCYIFKLGGEQMTQGERIRYLRKEVLKITLEQFGKKIGVTKSAISNLENESRNLTEQVAKAICREFNVDYLWLTEGTGDIFLEFPRGMIDVLAEENNLDEFDVSFIKTYINAPDDEKKAIKNFLKRLNNEN